MKSKADYGALLKKYTVDNFQINPWWKLFDRGIAVKHETAIPVGTTAKRLSAVMRCGACGQTQWKRKADVLKCQHCGGELSTTNEGIVLN